MRQNHRPRRIPLAVAAVLTAVACSESTGPEDPSALTLSVVSERGGGASMLGPARVVTQDDGTNTLDLTRVAVVLREIELKRARAEDCNRTGPDDDPCEEFEAGPFLLELTLNGSVDQVMAIQVPPDIYDEIQFEIHKPESDTPADIELLQANPDFTGVSVRVEGTWNGEPFVFIQDLNEEQEIALVPPLVVAAGGAGTNVTLSLELAGWFRSGEGMLVDPRTANKGGDNEKLVEDNIRRSVEAFEDRDRDGHRDG